MERKEREEDKTGTEVGKADSLPESYISDSAPRTPSFISHMHMLWGVGKVAPISGRGSNREVVHRCLYYQAFTELSRV
jgi:hypothetical protein